MAHSTESRTVVVHPTHLMEGSPPPPEALVTLANWRTPPFNRWAYQNVRNLIPTAPIERAGPVWSLPSDPKDLSSIEFTSAKGGAVSVSQWYDQGYVDGFLVLHQGRIISEQYFNHLTARRPHILKSVSKTLTALLAGQMVGRGELSPQDPVVHLIPELAGSAFADCQLQHILDMTVGVDFSEDYLANAGAITEYREVSGWSPPGPKTQDSDLRQWLPGLRKSGEHGAKFHYVSPCTDLLGWVIERATGQPFTEVFSQRIWGPLGAEYDAYITVDKLGAPRTAGGICTTLRDLARVGQLTLQKGHRDGVQIIPEAWFDDTIKNYDREAWLAQEPLEFLPNGGYRNKWWITGNPHGAFTGIGVYGQWLYVDPVAEMVIATFASHPLPVDEQLSEDTVRCFHAIGETLAN